MSAMRCLGLETWCLVNITATLLFQDELYCRVYTSATSCAQQVALV